MPSCQPTRVEPLLHGPRASPGEAALSLLVPTVGGTPTPELLGRIQLGCVEGSSLRSIGITGEPSEAPRAVKECHCRQSASGLADDEGGNERWAGFGILFHQTLKGDRDLKMTLGGVNTSLGQTADLPALHLGLERLRLKAEPRSNSFRSDDNRTVCDGDRPWSQ